MARMRPVTFVVPCYNEASRLDVERFAELAARPGIHLLFVDDGSTDGTRGLLDALVRRGRGRIGVLGLTENSGKAEAVRRGLLDALTRGHEAVGFADADLATPPEELVRLVTVLEEKGVQAVLGARVVLMGGHIERRPWRHATGRVFAMFATAVLRVPFYDTQCGAKVFRPSAQLAAALRTPFHSRWAFDVELLGRLLSGSQGVEPMRESAFVEVPLRRWVDVAGSKRHLASMVRATLDLGVIAVDLARRRRSSRERPLATSPARTRDNSGPS